MARNPLIEIFRRMFYQTIATWLLAIHTAYGAGVAVTKEQSFHADKSAKPFVFNDVSDSGHFVRFVTGGRTLTIERTTYLDYVEVPSSFPTRITTAEEIGSIRKTAETISAFSIKYPAAEPLLRQNLEALRKVLEAYENGWVLYENSWMRAEDFAPIRERLAQLEKEAGERREKEAQERKEELAKAESGVTAEMERNSLKDAEYTIRESVGTGSFIELAERQDPSELMYLDEP